MSKNVGILTAVLAVVALCLAGLSLGIAVKAMSGQEKDTQYVMYLGTNDKDTNEPVFSPDEAKEKAEDILIDNFGGYTIQEAKGGWEDSGTRYEEYTMVIYLSDTSLDKVHAAADKMLDTFHQSSVLIQSNETVTEFYDGGK